eukprot:TRINITY_DN421_c1_g2_i1.p1 TRINITY_DN421_c1_g2~~TRINITY_DN421_c1_g2_i1.p1  ORF type:complete len:608 (-),score=110.32 TRINITY_DN421_c1_g2_i1:259-2082(-)
MVGIDKEAAPTPVHLSTTKKQLIFTAMKRTGEWILSQEIPSDLTVKAGGASFALHKFPLLSKCGYIRKRVLEAKNKDLSVIEIPDIPGGAELFEMAAKFCYGINFEIAIEDIATLRCAAEYLEMTEEYATGNLVDKTEAYLSEVVFKSLSNAISVLHSSENLLPMAEDVKLVSRSIDAVAYLASKESQFSSSWGTENSLESTSSSTSHIKSIVDWWAEDLTVLRIDVFQRVLMAMKSRGFKEYALGPILMLYAQKSLRGLDLFNKGIKKIMPREEHEKRVVLETIVSLLPREKNAMSVSFLSMLLRSAIYLETTVSCRLDLEKRLASQLGQAVLDDLLIPSFSFPGSTIFNVDTIQRIMINYLEFETNGSHLSYNTDEDSISLPGELERVGKLMESYLSEIASDVNLNVSKFIGLAELIPEQARVTEDGIYRAIDIYLKAHSTLSDMERKKICSLMDCQKLSREACAHAAQNERLPVQTVVQVLYYEQQRFRDAMNLTKEGEFSASPAKMKYMTDHHRHPDELSSLRRENEDLKLELVKMKMRLREIEKPAVNTPLADKPPLPKKSIINSISKTLGRLNPFLHFDGIKPSNAKGRTKPSKTRRHSIS